jgi:hypothetical protein
VLFTSWQGNISARGLQIADCTHAQLTRSKNNTHTHNTEHFLAVDRKKKKKNLWDRSSQSPQRRPRLMMLGRLLNGHWSCLGLNNNQTYTVGLFFFFISDFLSSGMGREEREKID